jgi:putative hydrolase of the HAD superfamily
MGKKWITFDLDGTLMQNPFGEWVFPEIERIAGKYLVGGKKILHELVQEHRNRMDAGLIVEAYDWDDIVEKVFSSKQILEKVDVEELVKKHSIRPKVFLLEDGVEATLLQLKEKGFSLAVVTNGFEKYQKPVMDVLGLTNLFDVIITPEKVGYGKPQIEMMASLLQDGDELVAHVGDRLDHDVVFANTLSVLSILVYRNMPERVKVAHPFVRSGMEECMNWFRVKWQKETGKTELPNNAIPKMVIQSIIEIEEKSLI